MEISLSGEDPHEHRNDVEAVPEVEQAQRVAEDPGLRILADHGAEEPQAPREEPAPQAPPALAAQRDDESDAHHGQHEELGRAECEHQGAHHGNGERQGERTHHGPDERAHQGRAQRPPRFAFLGHRIPVQDRRGSRSLSGDAEEDRGDIPRGGDHGMHSQEEGEGLRGAHRVGEGEHQRQRGAAPEPGQEAHPEAEPDAEQHEGKRLPVKDQE